MESENFSHSQWPGTTSPRERQLIIREIQSITNSALLCLDRNTLDSLQHFKRQGGIAALEDAIENLLGRNKDGTLPHC